MPRIKCKKCGKEFNFNDGMELCPFCGAWLSDTNDELHHKSEIPDTKSVHNQSQAGQSHREYYSRH